MAIQSTHKRIARGAIFVALLMLGTRMVLALREMAIAWRYGTSATADAFQLALTISTWAAMMLAGVLAVVLVPRLVGIRDREKGYWSLISELNGMMMLAAILIGGAVWICAPLAVELMAGPLPPDTRQLALIMARWMAPAGALTLIAGYLAARLQARERFGYTAVEGLPAAALILFVLAVPADPAGGPLVYGLIVGLVLQAGLLIAMTRRSEGAVGDISFTRRSPEWRTLGGGLLILTAGQLMIGLATPLDQAFAAYLGGGAIAAYGYANRIIGLLLTVGPIVIGRAVLPVTSEIAAKGEFEIGRRHCVKWAWLMFVIGLGALLAGWLVSPWAVRILFERGAFGSEESAVVTNIVRFGLVQVPPFLGGLVLVQWFAALRRYDILFQAATMALAIKVLLNILLVPGWGMAGLMLASAGMYLGTFIFQIVLIGRAHERTARVS